jgi:diguanylate cyclase (GGDEF)-like protein
MSQLIDHLAELTALRDRDSLDATLASAVADLLRPRSVAIYRVVGQADAQRWMTRARLRQGDVVATGDPVWVAMKDLPRLLEHPLRCAALAGEVVNARGLADGGGAVSIFPLATDRETAGVMEIVSDEPPDAAAQSMVCSVLRIYRNFQCLLDYSERDTLTGLLNRKTFDENFFKVLHEAPAGCSKIEERRRASLGSGSSWLAMVDIDFFKSVNDNYGHMIGDEVLLLLARLMRGSLRFDDRLYRFGGEEFVILMNCDGAGNAASSLERLRRKTEAYVFPQVGRLTVSIGFTSISPSDSPSSALERADRAVYHAKDSGRNQVCSHGDLMPAQRATMSDHVGAIELF